MLRPLLSLTELESRLAVITARHPKLTSLSFWCVLVAVASVWLPAAFRELAISAVVPTTPERGERMGCSEGASWRKVALVMAGGCMSGLLFTVPKNQVLQWTRRRYIRWETVQRLCTQPV